MPAGYAWGKSYRTCKSCIGTDYCRFGLGDSMDLAPKIERRFRGLDSPGKLKLATAGCPRNCSEALVKDVGAVAVEGGKWEIYVGGAAGAHVRKGDLLCTVDSHDEVLLLSGRFIQYYRENAKYKERTYAFVERARHRTHPGGRGRRQRGHRGRARSRRCRNRSTRPHARSLAGARRTGDAPTSSTSLSRWSERHGHASIGWARSPRSRRGRGAPSRSAGRRSRCSTPATAASTRPRPHCPHRGGPLADGLVGDGTLVCPLHEWRFDLATGTAINGQCSIAVYPVRTTEDREILLTIDGA